MGEEDMKKVSTLLILSVFVVSVTFPLLETTSTLATSSEYTLSISDDLEMSYECWLDAKSLSVKSHDDYLFFKLEFYGTLELNQRFGFENLYIDADRDNSTGVSLRDVGYDYWLKAYCWGGGTGWGYLYKNPGGLIATEHSEPPLIIHSELGNNFLEVGIPVSIIGNPTSIDFFAKANSFGADDLEKDYSYEIGKTDYISIDGDPEDWKDITPILTDPQSDYSPPEFDFVAVYITDNSTHLFHRIDVADAPTGHLGGQNSELQRKIWVRYDLDNNPGTGIEVGGYEARLMLWYASTSSGTYTRTYMNNGTWIDDVATAAFDSVFEASIPITNLGASSESEVRLFIGEFVPEMYDSLPDTGYVTYSTARALAATANIDPGTLNSRSQGKWITAYIQLHQGHNPAEINASTTMLNGTLVPVLDPKYGFVRNPLVDFDGDGILEYMLKFDRAAVQSFIYDQGFRSCEVALTVVGKLFDDTAFEGTDIIKVVTNTPFARGAHACELTKTIKSARASNRIMFKK